MHYVTEIVRENAKVCEINFQHDSVTESDTSSRRANGSSLIDELL